MKTEIHERTFPNPMSCVTDGSVAGTRFYNDDTGAEMVPTDVTVQQEGMSEVRIRFAARYGIDSFVMGPDDTLTVNAAPAA